MTGQTRRKLQDFRVGGEAQKEPQNGAFDGFG
jgi:hypothetical protein